MIKVSVIIPVYNAEKYIEKCLDSVINQTLREIEIICIDDCSTDNSYSILEIYSKKDSRIIVQKNSVNSGSGFSRNIALSKANGEYIGFVDSDDFIDKNYYEYLYNTAKKYNTDMCFTLNWREGKKDYVYEMEYKNENDYFLDFDINTILSLYGYMSVKNNRSSCLASFSIWNRIFSRNMIKKNNITFTTSSLAEDYFFLLEFLAYNPKISYNSKALYYYRLNINSAIHKKRHTDEIVSNLSKMFDRLFNIYYNNSIDSIMYILDRMTSFIFEYYKNSNDKQFLYDELNKNIIDIVKDRKYILPNNSFLRKVYICFIEKNKKKYLDNILIGYNFTRKIVPRFILNMLRKRNLFL